MTSILQNLQFVDFFEIIEFKQNIMQYEPAQELCLNTTGTG